MNGEKCRSVTRPSRDLYSQWCGFAVIFIGERNFTFFETNRVLISYEVQTKRRALYMYITHKCERVYIWTERWWGGGGAGIKK
jgi:hypothetical protein